jgi:hypothetical protein
MINFNNPEVDAALQDGTPSKSLLISEVAVRSTELIERNIINEKVIAGPECRALAVNYAIAYRNTKYGSEATISAVLSDAAEIYDFIMGES